MKKQLIFLVMISIFIFTLCDSVSANETQMTDNLTNDNSQTTSNNENETDPRIYGVVTEIYDEITGTYLTMDSAKPVEGANITIKDPSNDSIITTAITGIDGKYDIIFISPLTSFNVEIAYSTYKTYMENVTPTIPTDSTIAEAQVNHTFMPDIAILCSNPELANTIKNLDNRRLIHIDIWYETSDKDWIIQYVNFAFIYMAMPGSGWGDTWYDELLKSPANTNYMVSSTFGYPCDTDTNVYGGDGLHLLGGHDISDTENTLENTYLGSYYYLASGTALETNLNYMIEYIYYLLGEKTNNPTQNGKSPIMAIPSWGIYHPDYPTETISAVPTQNQIKTWIESNPGYTSPYYSLKWMDENYSNWSATSRNTIYQAFENWYNTEKSDVTGSFIVIVSYTAGGETIDALIREYESQGRAVLNLFQSETTPSAASLLEELVVGINGNGPLERDVSAVTSLYSWSLDYNDLATGDGALTELENIDLEIIKAIQLYDANSLTSELGAQSEWTYAVTYPYFEGVFSPVVLSYTDENGVEHPLESGVEKLVTLTNSWAKLKELPNEQKKIAIILYNYPPGKAEMGASYLDVFQSVHDLLVKLEEAGYDLGTDEIPTVDELYTLVAEFGNKGSWAQNLLEQYVENNLETLQINGQLVDSVTYIKWFNELPEALQQDVIAEWGSALGDIMVYDEYLVIPGILLGNVFITVQPSRGWEEVEDYHDLYLPPSHQYIVFYNWLEDVFGANAMIHMGTHGTLEFLPGRTVGLQEDDWTFQLTNIPNINPYIVSNPGEGMVAKNRANALIIDHMTPAMVSSGLYGDLVEIHELIHQYQNALTVGNNQILPALKDEITAKADEMGFDSQTEEQTFDNWMEELHFMLHEIENDIIPLGLHTIGKILTGDELVEEVFTISSSMSSINNHMKNVLYPEITVDYYDMQKDNQYESEIEDINTTIKDYIKQIANGADPSNLGITDPDLLTDLEYCQEIIDSIRNNQEWKNLLDALSGGFISSGLGADPSYADVLPTGMNFYSSDPEKMPTKAAWETAKALVDEMLIKYYQDHGEFPETIGMVMWGTELLRTDGIAIAEFLYLLGVQIVWESNGDVNPNSTLIPLEDLTINMDGITMQRPRIDVFTTAVIGNEIWINLMNNAVLLVSQANETLDENYLIKHLAENPSLDRIFGLDGLVLEGTGISDLAPNTSKWETSDDLASVYLSRVSFAWRSTNDGVTIQQNQDTFQYLLKTSDIITQNIDSTWRLLDSDDYYDWYGGMLLASQNLGGNPDGLLADIRNQNDIKIRDVREEIELEIRSQLLNPTYRDSLLNTPSGWIEYAERYENLFGMSSTTGSVSNQMWTQVSQNLLDLSSNGLSSDYQGYAMGSMLGWAIEAARRDLWQPSQQMLTELANAYIETTVQYGVSCCHHTCGNLVFNQWVIQSSSLDSAALQQFANTMNSATSMGLKVGSTSNDPSSNPEDSNDVNSPGETVSATTVDSSSSNGDKKGSSTSAHEVTIGDPQESSTSQMPIYAVLGVLLLIGLFGAGYYYKVK